MTDMARMPAAGTWPEREVIAAVRRVTGEEPLTQVAGLPGTPDVVVARHRAAILAMGCFWHHHGHGCPISRMPKDSGFDWQGKFARTMSRDLTTRDALIALGYRVLWVWECALRSSEALQAGEVDARIARFLGSCATFEEVEGAGVQRHRARRAS